MPKREHGRPKTKASAKRQRHPRAPLVAPVHRYDGGSVAWSSFDLSEGGAFVQGIPLLETGSELEVGLWLPHDKEAVEIITRARVAWVNDGTPLSKPGYPNGMGVEFLDLDEHDARALREYLQNAANAAQTENAAPLVRHPPVAGADAALARPAAAEAQPHVAHAQAPQPRAAPPQPPRVLDPQPHLPQQQQQQQLQQQQQQQLQQQLACPSAPQPQPPQHQQACPPPVRAEPTLQLPVPQPPAQQQQQQQQPAAAHAAGPGAVSQSQPPYVAPVSAPSAEPGSAPKRPEGNGGLDGVQELDDAVAVGSQIGSYRILELLGSGGMGDVFLAEHVQLGRRVALKRLAPRFTRDAKVVRRFFDEARVVNQIRHPNLIEITDFISEQGCYFYVMELLEGCTLSQLHERDGPAPLPRVIDIAIQLCDALDAVHNAGVVHRDLKPANVMLVQRDDEHDLVKLLDFGVAKLRDPVNGMSIHATSDGLPLGTPGYMAPEQLLEGRVDHRSDIYAFGVLLYQMVTKRKPFVASTWGELLMKHAHDPPKKLTADEARGIPKPLQALILRCLEKEPEKRPPSAAAIAAALRRILATLPQADSAPGARATRGSFFDELMLVDRTRWRVPVGVGLVVAALLGAYLLIGRAGAPVAPTALLGAAIEAVQSSARSAAADPSAELPAPSTNPTTGRPGWATVLISAEPTNDPSTTSQGNALHPSPVPPAETNPTSPPPAVPKPTPTTTDAGRETTREAPTAKPAAARRKPKRSKAPTSTRANRADTGGSLFDQFED